MLPSFLSTILLMLSLSNVLFAKGEKSTEIDSALGRKILKILRKSDPEQDTTSYRKEFKSVVAKSFIDQKIKELPSRELKQKWYKTKSKKDQKINLENRDEVNDGVKNITFTLYGRNIFFMNLGIKTKIKLRVRFYLEKNQLGEISRSRRMPKEGFLEIKIKNPSPAHMEVTEKYRIKLPDERIKEFYQLSDKDGKLSDNIYAYFESLLNGDGSPNKKAKMDGIRQAIDIISAIEPRFIKPKFGTSYERESYKYNEGKYLKNGLRSKLLADDVEYQVTIDSHIVGFVPRKTFRENLQFNEYFQIFHEDVVFHYPEEASAVEVKVPYIISQLSPNKRSKIHKIIQEVLIDPIFVKENIFPGFMSNRGKAGTFLNFVLENKIGGVL